MCSMSRDLVPSQFIDDHPLKILLFPWMPGHRWHSCADTPPSSVAVSTSRVRTRSRVSWYVSNNMCVGTPSGPAEVLPVHVNDLQDHRSWSQPISHAEDFGLT